MRPPPYPSPDEPQREHLTHPTDPSYVLEVFPQPSSGGICRKGRFGTSDRPLDKLYKLEVSGG